MPNKTESPKTGSQKPSISRYPVPELADLPEDLRRRILEVQEKAGFVPNVFLTLAHRPDEARAFFDYHDALMLRPSGLGKGEKEMIVVATSGANQCLYCVVAHGAILRVYEKAPQLADQVATNYLKADLTPRQKAMLGFAMKVSRDSGAMSASWYAKNARHSAGRRASARNTFGTKPAFSWTSRMRARMSSGTWSRVGAG